MVFDTGQILFGLLALSAGEEGDSYLGAARLAGEWILKQQDLGGNWVRHSYRGISHTYYARVAWALVLLSRRTGDERFLEAARRHLIWVRSQQREDGWYSNCSFYPDEMPVLHVIAYTIRGVWESALLLGDAGLEDSAVAAADRLCTLEQGRGWLESHFGPGWRPAGRSVCATGLCQISGIWFRMALRYDRKDFAEAARRCIGYVQRRQLQDPRHLELHGAIPGSLPPWGDYFPWAFPNWGSKFFVDAVLTGEGIIGKDDVPG